MANTCPFYHQGKCDNPTDPRDFDCSWKAPDYHYQRCSVYSLIMATSASALGNLILAAIITAVSYLLSGWSWWTIGFVAILGMETVAYFVALLGMETVGILSMETVAYLMPVLIRFEVRYRIEWAIISAASYLYSGWSWLTIGIVAIWGTLPVGYLMQPGQARMVQYSILLLLGLTETRRRLVEHLPRDRKENIDLLISSLSDKSPVVRKAAADTLAQLDLGMHAGKHAYRELYQLSFETDDESLAKEAGRIRNQCNRRETDLSWLNRVDEEIAGDVVRCLADAGDAARQRWFDRITERGDLWKNPTWWIAAFDNEIKERSDSIGDLLRKNRVEEHLLAGLRQSSELYPTSTTIDLLCRLGAAGALTELVSRFDEQTTRRVYREAIDAGWRPESDVEKLRVGLLIGAAHSGVSLRSDAIEPYIFLLNDRFAEVREKALLEISRRDHDWTSLPDVATFVSHLVKEMSEGARYKEAAALLIKIGDASCADAVAAAMSDAGYGEREEAIAGVLVQIAPHHYATLISHLVKEMSEGTRYKEAAALLIKIGDASCATQSPRR